MHTHAMQASNSRARRASPKAIPWSQFDRARYPEPALALAYDAARKLATGEYLAVEGFSRISAALSRHGAPFDLIALGASIPADEIRHAEQAVRVASLVAGRDVGDVPLDVARMRPKSPADYAASMEALDLVMVQVSAVGETLSAALLTACMRQASDPVIEPHLASIVRDEVHHARLGWYYLAWRAPQWTARERQRIADAAAIDVMQIEVRFATGRDAPRGSARAARALGVLSTPDQRRVVCDVMTDEIVPALDAIGLGASHAWRARRRAK